MDRRLRLRKWTSQTDNHAIAPDLRLALNIENGIGVAARRKIYQRARDVVAIVSEIKRAAGRSDSAGDRRVVNWAIQLQRDRAGQVGEIVSHYERVSSLDTQPAKQRRAREALLSAFLDRLTAARVYQVG